MWKTYEWGAGYDELFESPGVPRAQARRLVEALSRMSAADVEERKRRAELAMLNLGITFTVYSESTGVERIFPFDLVPRIIDGNEWDRVEQGLKQRVLALNHFIQDVYNERRIIEAGVIPADVVYNSPNYQPAVEGFTPPNKVWAHISGIDLVRDADGTLYVLEDNARTPSGVSYVLQNRILSTRTFPSLMAEVEVERVSDYARVLHEAVRTLNTAGPAVVLTPGIYNSAYFEHIFLARQMGVPLVEGRDLTVEDDRVYMKTIAGLQRVDVIYRRIDDAFLDPECFNPESMLGVPGLMRAARAGNVALANAVGNGVADDKAVYAYMPRIIEYYLSEKPILENVQTNICREPEALAYTLDNLDKLVVKPVGESGGYGIVVGPKATAAELAECAERLKADPENFISQPMIELSVGPTLTDRGVVPCHVDLRPFAVTGKETWVLPGGLTRVAMKKGSIIVNSSQGGGTKDTWVLETEAT